MRETTQLQHIQMCPTCSPIPKGEKQYLQLAHDPRFKDTHVLYFHDSYTDIHGTKVSFISHATGNSAYAERLRSRIMDKIYKL